MQGKSYTLEKSEAESSGINRIRRERDEWKARAEQEAKRLDWVLSFYGDANRSFSLDTSRKVIDAELSAISAQEPPK